MSFIEYVCFSCMWLNESCNVDDDDDDDKRGGKWASHIFRADWISLGLNFIFGICLLICLLLSVDDDNDYDDNHDGDDDVYKLFCVLDGTLPWRARFFFISWFRSMTSKPM